MAKTEAGVNLKQVKWASIRHLPGVGKSGSNGTPTEPAYGADHLTAS